MQPSINKPFCTQKYIIQKEKQRIKELIANKHIQSVRAENKMFDINDLSDPKETEAGST